MITLVAIGKLSLEHHALASSEREGPRRKAVASYEFLSSSDSSEREGPRHKAVASLELQTPCVHLCLKGADVCLVF